MKKPGHISVFGLLPYLSAHAPFEAVEAIGQELHREYGSVGRVFELDIEHGHGVFQKRSHLGSDTWLVRPIGNSRFGKQDAPDQRPDIVTSFGAFDAGDDVGEVNTPITSELQKKGGIAVAAFGAEGLYFRFGKRGRKCSHQCLREFAWQEESKRRLDSMLPAMER